VFSLKTAFVLLSLCAATGWAAPESTKNTPREEESDIRELALSARRSLTTISASQYLRALRAEVYDEPFQPGWLAPKGMRAYLIIDSGVEGTAGGRPIVHTSTGQGEVLVLVDPTRRKAFALRGSPDPMRGFNALVRDLDIKINSPESAIRLFWIFADVASGYAERVVQESRAAQWQVEGYGFRQSGGDGLDEARDAWLKTNAASLRQISPPRADPVEGGYEVVFFVVDNGTVHRRRLLIDPRAGMKTLEDSPITSAIKK